MVAQKEDENKKFLKEVLNIDSSFIEAEGIKNPLKYFDRINDKLFTINNILMVGFFTLI
jgi:hypothetical protein